MGVTRINLSESNLPGNYYNDTNRKTLMPTPKDINGPLAKAIKEGRFKPSSTKKRRENICALFKWARDKYPKQGLTLDLIHWALAKEPMSDTDLKALKVAVNSARKYLLEQERLVTHCFKPTGHTKGVRSFYRIVVDNEELNHASMAAVNRRVVNSLVAQRKVLDISRDMPDKPTSEVAKIALKTAEALQDFSPEAQNLFAEVAPHLLSK